MGIIVKLYSDKNGRQYRVSIPKKIVELQGYSHMDEFELQLQGKDIILRKVER
jgi:bifunctional DNA-binding transcriptional regulator/antitoxin component of YhaV-PrlF toxin-antitoxin module